MSCHLLGARCCYLGELCPGGSEMCLCCCHLICSPTARTWLLSTMFRLKLCLSLTGLFHHPALMNRVSLLAMSFKGGKNSSQQCQELKHLFPPELPLLLPAAKPAPVFFKAGETQTLCVVITVLASLSHVSALHASGVFLVLAAYLALSLGSVRQIFKS